MKVYVAGPMTGIENYNWPAFEEAAAMLRRWGYEVVSPTEIDEEMDAVIVSRLTDGTVWNVRTTPSFDYDSVLATDLKHVENSDAIYLLQGWQKSKGARMELETALRCGLVVWVQ